MRKYHYSLLLFLFLQTTLICVYGQNIGINTSGALPDSSAALDISSTSSGILVPRMTTAQVNAITRPATGLMVYNTTTSAFQVNTGSSTTPSWATVYSTRTATFGSTDSTATRITTYNIPRITIDSTGNVGIGNSPAFTSGNPEKLLVDAGTTGSYNVISAKGTINNYLQLNIQNKSTGTSASSDLVSTADNGNESSNYVDLGINGSGYTGGFFGSANDAYLYNLGQNFLIGTGTSGKSLIFMTGGGDQATNERMRISSAGYVGITTTSPISNLDVEGSTGNSITTTSSNLTLDGTHHTVIITGGTPTITLPAASGCTRRIYVISNLTGTQRTISSYKNLNGSAVTKVPANTGITIQSDGTTWYQIM